MTTPATGARTLATTLVRAVTAGEIATYPIHLDPEAARAAGFPGVIAHGAGTSIGGRKRDGDG